jgi:hypothetical protein
VSASDGHKFSGSPPASGEEVTVGGGGGGPLIETTWGSFEIGLYFNRNYGFFEINVKDPSQPVSIPLTFYVRSKWADRSICVRARGCTVLRGRRLTERGELSMYVTGSFGLFPVRPSSKEKIFNLGRPRTTVPGTGGEVLYALTTSVEIVPAELLDIEDIKGENVLCGAVCLAWIDCDSKTPLHPESRFAWPNVVAVWIKESKNYIPPPRPKPISLPPTETVAVYAVNERASRGWWEVGTYVREVVIASLHQRVSIPLTFRIQWEWRNEPVCVKIRAVPARMAEARKNPNLIQSAKEKLFELGRSHVCNEKERMCELKSTVTVAPAELLDEEVKTGSVTLIITWVDCNTMQALSRDVAIEFGVKPSRNILAPPSGKYVEVEPASGTFSITSFPNGIFPISVSASDEVELSFAIGVGLSEEQARRSAVEVELVDSRTGARLRKVKASSLRLRFRLPPALPAPVYVYLEPRANGMPVSARIWSFS